MIWLNIGLSWKIIKICSTPFLVSHPKRFPKSGVLFLLYRKSNLCWTGCESVGCYFGSNRTDGEFRCRERASWLAHYEEGKLVNILTEGLRSIRSQRQALMYSVCRGERVGRPIAPLRNATPRYVHQWIEWTNGWNVFPASCAFP